jgi:hypothetical protein
VRIKVRGGTAAHGEPSLCETCRWSTIVRGTTLRDEIVECDALSYRNKRVTFPVASCSRYVNRNHPTIREMEQTAWLLRSDPHRNQIGFVHSSRFTDDERYVLEED